jgi:hypothetical protein
MPEEPFPNLWGYPILPLLTCKVGDRWGDMLLCSAVPAAKIEVMG